MKNLAKEYLKDEFFKDKDKVIMNYLKWSGKDDEILTYTYKSGKQVLVDTVSSMAYSRNGFLFEVILKDDLYIVYILNSFKNEILEHMDDKLIDKYEEVQHEWTYQCKNDEVISVTKYDNKYKVCFQKGGSPVILDADAVDKLLISYEAELID